jgi:hypothetical protein
MLGKLGHPGVHTVKLSLNHQLKLKVLSTQSLNSQTWCSLERQTSVEPKPKLFQWGSDQVDWKANQEGESD